MRLSGRSVSDACHVRSVDVVQWLTVSLDRTALAGLIRVVDFLQTINRQQAARFLLADAVARFSAVYVVPTLRDRRHAPDDVVSRETTSP